MYRLLEAELIAWKNQPGRKPLLIRGARQVGKSYLVEQFGKQHFDQLVVVNFELEERFIGCFENLDPQKIIAAIELIAKRNIEAGNTLLFFDEIQQCPKAIIALRYFKEKMPELHVIGAGSFLEFVIKNEQYQQPVGRVQSLYLKPCSFKEFLIASGNHQLLEYLSTITLKTAIELPIHQLLLEKCREYFILGGMPEVIDYYLKQKKFLGCDQIHASILEYYRRDLVKYGRKLNVPILEKMFTKAPGLIAKRFKYVDIDAQIPSREQKPVLEALEKAGIVYFIHHTAANGLPLQASIDERNFKLLFMDIGLAKHSMGLDVETLLHDDLTLVNQGNLSEQFVGQELLAYGKAYEETRLFYWEREKRGSQAEVDYVISIGPHIYPVEVKSGKSGRLRSLRIFLEEKKIPFGIRISQNELSFYNDILSVPLYMIFEITRLVQIG